MVSFSSPSINFAVAPDSPHYGLSTASPRTYSSESLSSPPISDISELEDCDSMSLDDQLNSLSELRIQDLKSGTDMKHPDYYITGGDVVFLVRRCIQSNMCCLSFHLLRAIDVGGDEALSCSSTLLCSRVGKVQRIAHFANANKERI